MKNFGRIKKCITFAVLSFSRAGICPSDRGYFLLPDNIFNLMNRCSSCAVAVMPANIPLENLAAGNEHLLFLNNMLNVQNEMRFMGSHTLCGSRFNGKAEEAEV